MLARFETRDEIGIIRVDHPPVNAISLGVRQGILAALKEAEGNAAVKAVVIACEGRTFMAGADITEFGKPRQEPTIYDLMDALEAFPKPVVAAIHGTAFGGGFEVTLASDWRVAVASAKVGLPEVKIGIFPSAGGSQRLPRLIGADKALQIMTSGDPIAAPAAQKMGLIDKIVEGDLVDGAVAFARDKVRAGDAKRRIAQMKIDPVVPGYFDEARKRYAREKRNLNAPQVIVDAVEAAATLSFEEGTRRERALSLEIGRSTQARALQHVFFAERQAAKIPGLAADVKPRPVRSAAVIGAGTMGGGIAMNFANAGIPVAVLEVNQDGLDRGLSVVRRNYEATAAKGRITEAQVKERMGLIRPTLAYDDLGEADLVIEAVFETMEIKKTVFGELDRVAKKDAVLASNTSYLSIDTIGEATSRPADVLGLHFFSPANVMRLLEIVRGDKTAPEVLVTALDLAKKIGKVGVVAGNADGFIGNRMLQGYSHQAQLLALEGARPEQIDGALRAFGMPMGLFQMADLAGLDVGYKSRKDRDPSTYDAKASAPADRLVEMNRLGQKTNAGYYDYEAGNRTPKPSPVVADLIDEVAREHQIRRREWSDEEIVERCFLAMVNIGCEVLREGIAYRASDIDITYIYGYGFPAYRGGPMFWAEHEVGLDKALDKIRGYSKLVGERWLKPSPLLEKLVAEGKGFASVGKG